MSFETHSGPIRVGTVREGAGRNTGLVVLAQSYYTDTVAAGQGNVDTQAFIIPAGSQILDITVDQVVVPNGSSTSTVSVGTASGGAQLMAAVVTTAGGRFRGTATAATQLAWQTSNTADTTVFVRYAIGTADATAGRAIVTVSYVQRQVSGTTALQNPVSA